MLERALTTQCCKEIVAFLLRKRGWSLSRMARTIDASTDYVRRVQTGKQSFQMADVDLLAKAIRLPAHRLIFDSIPAEGMSREMRGLHEIVQSEIDRHEEFKRVLNRKPAKTRRDRTKAA